MDFDKIAVNLLGCDDVTSQWGRTENILKS